MSRRIFASFIGSVLAAVAGARITIFRNVQVSAAKPNYAQGEFPCPSFCIVTDSVVSPRLSVAHGPKT
jgi:hypothetical protein